tara:strand:- start:1282 stop:1518 length:237 start_codon:yes stop_codon:yes gene_type:complete
MEGGNGIGDVFSKYFVKNPKRDSFIVIVVSVIIKSVIVMLTYNKIWPRLVENTGQDSSKFKPLTFFESLIFVLLFMFL